MWRRSRPADRKMVAARSVGFGWFLEKRRKEHSDFQQGAEGTKPRGGVLTLIADVGINIFIQSAGRPENRSDILDAKRIIQTMTH